MDLLIEKKRCYLPDCPTQNYGRDNSVDTSDTSSGNIFNPFFVDDEYNKQGSQKDNPFNGLKSGEGFKIHFIIKSAALTHEMAQEVLRVTIYFSHSWVIGRPEELHL